MDVELVPLGYLDKCYIFHQLLISLGEGSVSFYDNVVFFTETNCVFVKVKRMSLDLVDDGLEGRTCQQFL